jgi:hypothetical protein
MLRNLSTERIRLGGVRGGPYCFSSGSSLHRAKFASMTASTIEAKTSRLEDCRVIAASVAHVEQSKEELPVMSHNSQVGLHIGQ